MLCATLIACDKGLQSHAPHTAVPAKLADGTLAIDSGQGGAFEITILPLDLSASWEPNEKATKTSTIEIEVDKSIRTTVSPTDVIRIRGLEKRRHSLVEYVNGVRTSSFSVDGSTLDRLIADYYEIYGTWIIREPLTTQQAEAGADQPATKPTDKPPVKDQPPTPMSKDGPR